MAKKVVLAYSGGLDTSVILRWLIENYDAEVIALYIDLGQKEDIELIRKKAYGSGAKKFIALNCKEEFIREYFFPALRAQARYEDWYLMGTSLARPLIAKKMVEVAKKEKAGYIAHGATGKGNDQCRFELSAQALAPHLKIIAPWREWEFSSRSELIEYAKKRSIPVPVTAEKPYSSDANLLHISYEGGILEDPSKEAPEDMFQMTVSPEKALDKPEKLSIQFDEGIPIGINGKKLSPAKLVEELNIIGGKHGIGRVDLVESRFVGMKSRGVYETPGGTILHIAHRAISMLTLDREVLFLKDSLMPYYARLVYFGFWFSPEREMLQNMIDFAEKRVCGEVKLKLYKGNVIVLGRSSPRSLYVEDIASFEKKGGYVQADATGFINLNALRLRINSLVEDSVKPKRANLRRKK